MESSYPDDEIKRLHASFIEAMESDRNYSSFSEDDLIDIFDYSCSISNDFVVAEVIIAGERCFPNSRELLKRKALMYHHLGQEDACEAILNQLPTNSFLNFVVSTKDLTSSPRLIDLISKQLENIKTGTIEDGDIMYAVDFFNSLNCVDVLTELADEFSRISEYPSTIFNELMHLFWEKNEYHKAAEYGRKLTDVEPFNSSAWTELADLYNVHLANPQAAVECADFALAIEPNSLGALIVKSSALYEQNPEESRNIVALIMDLAPTDSMSFYARAILNINDGRREQGIEDIIHAISLEPMSGKKELVELLMKVIDTPLSISIENLIKPIFDEDDSIDAVKWCDALISSGNYVGAYQVFKMAYSVSKYDFAASDSIYLAVEVLYRMKYFEQVIELLNSGCKNNLELRLRMPMPLALIYSLAWIRLHPANLNEVRDYVNEKLALYILTPENKKVTDLLIEEASAQRMKLLAARISSENESIAIDDIDPFL